MSLFKETARNPCRAYLNVRNDENNRELRDFAEILWDRFNPYAEPNFRKNLSLEFHQRFWEMYLGCGLLNMGLIPEKQPTQGPDFKIHTHDQVTWIEAIVPGDGNIQNDKPNSVSYAVLEPADHKKQRVRSRERLLRLRHSVHTKHEKFQQYQKDGIVSASDCVVIAINGGLISDTELETDPPSILSALLPLGGRYVVKDHDNAGTVEQGFYYRSHLVKHSGSQRSTTLFSSRTYETLSAVLFCNSDIQCHPSSADDISTDFTLIHNPFATNPLPPGILQCGQEFVVEGDTIRRY